MEFFFEQMEPVDIYQFLDPGIASSVSALLSSGATPYASCNGGRLGGFHRETQPLVAFLGTGEVLKAIKRSARAVGADVWKTEPGSVVGAESLETMIAFAQHLSSKSQ